MAQFHLTKLENSGNDYRIRQGSEYLLIVYVERTDAMIDKTITFRACIKRKINSTSALAIFNTVVGSYIPVDSVGVDEQFWNTIPVTLRLSSTQTLAIPVPAQERQSTGDTKPGVNCWVWDLLMEIDDDPQIDLRIYDLSYVEVIPGITPTVAISLEGA
jgi:hypothetical protein